LLDVTHDRLYQGLYNLLENDIIEKVEVTEIIASEVALRKEVGAVLRSTQNLKLTQQSDSGEHVKGSTVVDAVKDLEAAVGQSLTPTSLVAAQPTCEGESAPVTFKNLLTSLKKHLKASALATKVAAKSFLRLVSAGRSATKKELETTLRDKKMKDVLPQLMDVLGAVNTIQAHQAVMSVAGPASNYPGLCERYMWSVAQQARAKPDVAKSLLSLANRKIENQKVRETLILTLGTVARTLPEKELSEKLLNWLISGLSACSGKVIPADVSACQLPFLRALKNRRDARLTATLLKIVQEGEKKPALAAAKALAEANEKYLDGQIQASLMTVFLDPGADTSLRCLAAVALLKTKPSRKNVRLILNALRFDSASNTEFNSLVLQRLYEFASKDSHLRDLVVSLSEAGHLNWDMRSQGGLSTAFSDVLFSTKAVNASYSFGMEMNGPLLKTSAFEVYLEDSAGKYPVLQLDVFAGGMAAFVGIEVPGGDDPSTNAGLELTVFGNQLRPFVFFQNMGELMSLYWSGVAGEKTSALQGTQILQDHHRLLRTTNGFVVSCDVSGAISYDFSGKADISLWTKTSESVVENSAALFLQATFALPIQQHRRMQLDHVVGGQAKLNMETDVNFSDTDNIETCIRMVQLPFTVQHDRTKAMSIGSKPVLKLKGGEKSRVQGRTLFLNAKNCELCNKMYPKDKNEATKDGDSLVGV
jgi:microsomal triglyceride transfer protein large subunit